MIMTLCLRIKRRKTTYFIQVNPTETILELKQKIEEYCSVRPEAQQISKKRSGTWRLLEDTNKIQEAGIQNDETLALAFLTEDGSFEAVDITPYEVEMASS